MSGIKHDTGKPDLSIIPMAALIEEAEGFMYGEGKYGRYNYCEGFKASRLVAAALRHIYAWNSGEDYDDESGVSHLGHARCCLAMLLECERLGTLQDDRYAQPPKSPSANDDFTYTVEYKVSNFAAQCQEHKGSCDDVPPRPDAEIFTKHVQAHAELLGGMYDAVEPERCFEIFARSTLSGDSFCIERCSDLTLAQARLRHSEQDWPTFKLSIREVSGEDS